MITSSHFITRRACCFRVFFLLFLPLSILYVCNCNGADVYDNSTEVDALGEVKVTAVPVDTGAEVIDADKKEEEKIISSVTDFISDSPGIMLQDSSFGPKVYIRGLDDEKYRIMIDGVPVANKGTYHARGFEWDSLPFDNISKIELLKGSYSSEWGGQPGGVINFITKKPPEEGLNADVTAGVGSFSEHRESLVIRGRHRNLGLVTSGTFYETHTDLTTHAIRKKDVSISPYLYIDDAKGWKISGFFHYPFASSI